MMTNILVKYIQRDNIKTVYNNGNVSIYYNNYGKYPYILRQAQEYLNKVYQDEKFQNKL